MKTNDPFITEIEEVKDTPAVISKKHPEPLISKETSFSKIKVSEKGVEIEYTDTYEGMLSEDGTAEMFHKKSSTLITGRRPHNDWYKVIGELKSHVIALCELLPEKEISISEPGKSMQDMKDKIVVTGVSFKGKDESLGVVIMGKKNLKKGNFMAINTPFTLINNDKATSYNYYAELSLLIDDLIEETLKFMAGKAASQLEINFG